MKKHFQGVFVITTITNTIKDVESNLLSGVAVRVSLVAPSGNTFTTAVSGGQDMSRKNVYAVTDETGTWTIDLIPSNHYVDPNTYYVLRQLGQSYQFRVPNTTSVLTLKQVLAIVDPVIPGGEESPPEGGGVAGLNPPMVYEQTTPATVWEFTHSLGYEPSSVQVIDSDGIIVWAEVSFPAIDRIRVTFDDAITGRIKIK